MSVRQAMGDVVRNVRTLKDPLPVPVASPGTSWIQIEEHVSVSEGPRVKAV